MAFVAHLKWRQHPVSSTDTSYQKGCERSCIKDGPEQIQASCWSGINTQEADLLMQRLEILD